jgi:hypothetical protein
VLADAEDRAGAVHLLAPDLGDVVLDVLAVLEGGVEDAAPLAAGAGDDEHIDTLVDVAGHGGRALARFVVRVRMHRHQPQLVVTHDVHCPRRAGKLWSPGPVGCAVTDLADSGRPVLRS